MEENKTVHLVMGIAESSSQKTLVGITKDVVTAKGLVNADYMSLLTLSGLTAIDHPIKATIEPGNSISSYDISGYSWQIFEITLDELVNFTL